jgi:hypothetical protein
VRFYTNRDGHAARQTTLFVLALIGVFYLFPPLSGTIGRARLADLDPARTDALLLELGGLFGTGPLAELVRAIAAAGAFAACSRPASARSCVERALDLEVEARAGVERAWATRPPLGEDERARLVRIMNLASSATYPGAQAMLLGEVEDAASGQPLAGWLFLRDLQELLRSDGSALA